MLAGSARAGADPLHWGDVVSASTAQLLLGLESFLGEPLRAPGGMAQLDVGGGLVGSSREGNGLGAAPWGADLLPFAFLNLASPLGQEFVLGKQRSRCTTNTSAASRRGRRGHSLKSEPKERATSAFLAGLGLVVVL